MRFLNGIVIGVLLTVGAAYTHDRNVSPGPDGAGHDLVNWQEFGRSVGAIGDWLRDQFTRLTASPHRPG